MARDDEELRGRQHVGLRGRDRRTLRHRCPPAPAAPHRRRRRHTQRRECVRRGDAAGRQRRLGVLIPGSAGRYVPLSASCWGPPTAPLLSTPCALGHSLLTRSAAAAPALFPPCFAIFPLLPFPRHRFFSSPPVPILFLLTCSVDGAPFLPPSRRRGPSGLHPPDVVAAATAAAAAACGAAATHHVSTACGRSLPRPRGRR